MLKIIFSVCLWIVVCSTSAEAAFLKGREFVPDEVILKFKAGVGEREKHAILSDSGAVLQPDPDGAFFSVAKVFPGAVRRVAAALRGHPSVVTAEPNYVLQAYEAPDDPSYYLQWHFPMIGLEAAWEQSTGDAVTVAVVDTGVNPDGPDGFGGRLLRGYNAFLKAEDRWEDNNLHGTHVAGTIAQETGNGIGVAGVAYDAWILPVKVLDASGYGTVVSVARGIRWAADNGADIINMSLGGSRPSWFLKQAVDYAHGRGVTVVGASGNEYSAAVGYPAAYDSVIAVGALDLNRQRAPYSNYGPELDVVAPGGDTTQDSDSDGYPDGVLQETFQKHFSLGWEYDWNYFFLQGTSMACPHVAGVAALIKAIHPDWGPEDIRQAIVETALDIGPTGRDDETGYGLVQAGEAVLY